MSRRGELVGVQPFDTVDSGVDEFERAQPGTPNQVCLSNGVEYREIVRHPGR